jgi:hypothetical protein
MIDNRVAATREAMMRTINQNPTQAQPAGIAVLLIA